MIDINRIYGLSIDLDKLKEFNPEIEFKQYDYQTSFIAFKFFKGDKQIMNIGDNYIIGVFKDEEGGLFVDTNGTPLKTYAFRYEQEEGVVILPINKEVINKVGNMACEILIIDQDGKKVTSPRFNFTIQPSLYDYKVENEIAYESICGTFRSAERLCGQGKAERVNVSKYISYEKTVWVDGETVVNQERLNNMENGIYNVTERLNELDAGTIRYETSADESITTIQDALDKLLYVPLTISLSCNRSVVEKGENITSLTFNWNYNKNVVQQTFEGESLDKNLRTYKYEKPVSVNKTFTLTANDGKNTVSKSTSITFRSGRYWGVSSIEEYDSNFIKTLSKELNESRAKTFTVNCGEGQHIFYCIPSRLGTPTFTVGGFSGGFYKANTIQFSNDFGYIESYDIWKSTNNNLGNTTVVVS